MTDDWMTPDTPLEDDATTPSDGARSRHAALVNKFASWLDRVLEEETPPAGVAAELLAALDEGLLDEEPVACSEHAVWAALSALEQEVKLQGKAFRNLTDTLEPLSAQAATSGQTQAERLEEAIAALETAREDLERRAQDAARDAAWCDIVDLLLDIRDRLCRSDDAFAGVVARLRSEPVASGISRWLHGPRRAMAPFLAPVESLAQGNRLIRERLDERLTGLGIHEVPAQGQPFDSRTMKAVDVELRDDVPEGTVSGVHQRGYTWRGELYRPAEVKVTRHGAVEKEGIDS